MEASILTEQVSDLARPDTNITGRDIHVFTNVTGQLSHKGLAKPHYFGIRFSFRVKIRSAFSAAKRKRRKAVLQNLLERKEFENPQVHTRMKPESSFVRPDRSVKLNPVSAIESNFTLIILPTDPEHDDAIRFGKALENPCFTILRVFVQKRPNLLRYFLNRLVKLGLSRVPTFQLYHKGV